MNIPRHAVTFLSLFTAIAALGAPRRPSAAPEAPPPRPLPQVVWEVVRGKDPVAGRMVASGGLDQRPSPQVLRFGLRGVGGFAGPVSVRLQAYDADGKPMPGADREPWTQAFTLDVPTGGRLVLTELPFAAPSVGWWRLRTELGAPDGLRFTAEGDLGIVPAPHSGARPNSFFGSNNAPVQPGEGGEMTQLLGMKVSRRQVPGITTFRAEDVPEPSDKPLPLEMRRIDADFEGARALGITPMTVPGYSFFAGSKQLRSHLAEIVNMYGPPRHFGEFNATWRTILERYPEIRLVEFWNEPWIIGWTWGDTPAEYRELQTGWARMALALHPDMRILAGNSVMFMEDHVEPFPECWKGLIAGLSHHPYTRSVDRPNLRGGDQRRAMDYGWIVTRRMGLDYYYITEGGTMYRTPSPLEADETVWGARAQWLERERRNLGYKLQAIVDKKSPEAEALKQQQAAMAKEAAELKELSGAAWSRILQPKNNRQNADKLPIYFTETALCGAFQGNAQWGIGVQEDTAGPNTAFAVLTHLTEDRVPFAEIWPESVLLGGAVFAMEVDLPEAARGRVPSDPLRQRRGIPVPDTRPADGRSVAVVWGYTGGADAALDADATLTLTQAGLKGRLKAYDVFGRRIPSRGADVVVPLGASPIWIVADAATPCARFLEELRAATLRSHTAVNVYAQSLHRPADQAQSWTVRVQSHHNRPLSGTVSATIPGGTPIRAPFTLAPGALADVTLPWPGVAVAADNRYPVGVTVEIATEEGQPVQNVKGEARTQLVQVARFARRTVRVDGTLDDWAGATPVLVDSEALVAGLDLSRYHLNPSLDKPTGDEARKRVVARVYAAYDDANVYLAARVHDDALQHRAGEKRKGRDPTTKQEVELPYRLGFPDGLEHPVNIGDCLQFAFGFRERVPGHGRQPGDPWMWKGQIVDTDYVYNVHPSTEGDQLVRNWGADTPRRNGYQTVQEPWQTRPDGSQVKIVRDEATHSTVWEIAIPRAELKLFDPGAGSLRFGFIVHNDEKVPLEWSAAAGVFDYWATLGSYAPSWNQHLPCQTTFGIDP
jgi:hypothetical protein